MQPRLNKRLVIGVILGAVVFAIGLYTGSRHTVRTYEYDGSTPAPGIKCQTDAYYFDRDSLPSIEQLDSILFSVINDADGASVDYSRGEMTAASSQLLHNAIDTLYVRVSYFNGGSRVKAELSSTSSDSICHIDYGSFFKPVKWSELKERPAIETDFFHYFDEQLGHTPDKDWVPQTIFRCNIKDGSISRVFFRRAYE